MIIAIAAVVLMIYTLFGVISGFVLAIIPTILKGLGGLEQSLHRWVDPAMARIVEKIPVGQEGIPLDQFNHIVNDKITALIDEIARQNSGRLNPFRAAYRFVSSKVLRKMQSLLIEHFVKDLQKNDETRVNAKAVEKFAREKLIGVVADYWRGKIDGIRIIVLALALLLLLIPLLLILA
ncbi:MAG: hypothetical protein ACREOI_12845 [bacterium]